MDKQEVIQKISDSKFCSKTIPLTYQSECFNQGMDAALKIISKLDEPQKVKVKPFIADWFEEHKDFLELSLGRTTPDIRTKIVQGQALSKFEKWFNKTRNKPFETIIRMKNGYEVEKEPQWVVKKSADSYFKAFNGIDFRSSSVAYEDYACLFADRAKAEAVALLVDGSVEEA